MVVSCRFEGINLVQDHKTRWGRVPVPGLWDQEEKQRPDRPQEPCGGQASGWPGGVSLPLLRQGVRHKQRSQCSHQPASQKCTE